jgi:hypothetical protein
LNARKLDLRHDLQDKSSEVDKATIEYLWDRYLSQRLENMHPKAKEKFQENVSANATTVNSQAEATSRLLIKRKHWRLELPLY